MRAGYWAEYYRRRRKEASANGVCTQCLKRKRAFPLVMCGYCNVLSNSRSRRRARRLRANLNPKSA